MAAKKLHRSRLNPNHEFVWDQVLGFMKEILFTIVPQSNVTITGDRVGLTRSAMRLGGARGPGLG